jgi:hypothetical protein
MKITLTFSDDDARAARSFLADRYGKRKDTSLEVLAMIAIRQEVAAQAQVDLDTAKVEVRREANDEPEWLQDDGYDDHTWPY